MSDSHGSPARIVVTGQGLVTPLGRSAETLVDNWLAGRSAAGPITKFDASTMPVRIACEVPNFEPRQEIRNRKLTRLLVRGEDYGVVAAGSAFGDAGLSEGGYDPTRAGIAAGIRKEGFRNSNFYDALTASLDADGRIDRQVFIEDGMRRIPPQTIVEGLANAAIYHIAHEHNLQGFNQNLLAIGSGGFQAIGEAFWALRGDEADLILAGAYNSWVVWTGIAFTHYVGIASTSTAAPETVHRPFDLTRSGSVIGEGAAFYVLEPLDRARSRGATVLGEICGFGMATGVPSSSRRAGIAALTAAIRRALDVAGLTPADIDFVHLHGVATLEGDQIEVRAIHEAFGERAARMPATTIKSATGFMGNASSSTEVAAILEVLRRGVIPPIVNLATPDPEFGLNFIREPLSTLRMRYALLISRGWPSQYVALVVGHPDA
ncbi:MAG: beta-ketoacyl synthase [Planctomycetaceae bacterium]